MWFRKTESPEVDASELNNNNNASFKPPYERSKFEKFRRASFRRKSLTNQSGVCTAGGPRRRSKSPHSVLRSSLEAAVEEDEEATEPRNIGKGNIDARDESVAGDESKNELKIGNNRAQDDDDEVVVYPGGDDDADNDDVDQIYDNKTQAAFFAISYPKATAENESVLIKNDDSAVASVASLMPLSDPPLKLRSYSKKPSLKSLKTDPPKRKFYKSFTSRRQNSRVDAADTMAISSRGYDDDSTPAVSKEKILLTDPKFRNNRIEKSSSKTKIAELEKRDSVKRSRSGRKLSTASPAVVEVVNEEVNKSKNLKKSKIKSTDCDSAANDTSSKFTRARAHSNLNLTSLVKFVVNNKRLLSASEFALMRRKSISEAASSIITVAATCKPLPIALKYTPDVAVAEAPTSETDAATNKNVVLVKKQKLKSSFCDRLSSNDDSQDRKQPPTRSNSKVKRNSSNSSKSSGIFEDEAFYSCDEQELGDKLRLCVGGEGKTDDDYAVPEVSSTTKTPPAEAVAKRKPSSPSLTSRVAAKINETTNNYKNRKAAAVANKTAAKKQRKSMAAAAGKRPEFYKQLSAERLHSTSIVRQPSDRRPDAANVSIRSNGNSSQHNSSDLQNSQASDASAAADAASSGAGGASSAVCGADSNAQDAADTSRDSRKDRLQNQHQQNKSAPVSVNRSESYKERLSHKRSRNSRRKTSDPSLASRPNDDQPDVGLSNSNYTASSNSSLSSGGGSESPSNSMDQVTAGVTAAPGQQQQQHGTHHHHHQHSNQDSFHSSTSGGASSGPNANNSSFWGGSMGSAGGPTRQWQFESDEDDDLQNEADWSSNVAAEMLAALTDAEKKRQEIINEIYQTERNHVRTLKLLERLFFCPLQESGVLSVDHLLLLFPPALLSLRELHSAFEQRLKQRRLEHNHVVLQVGDLLAGMFDGQSGEELCEYAAQFCARQQIALEALKEKRRKDESLQKILTKAESHKACRRLQLKDLLPTVLQRLTKYPLLFENLHKVTTRVAPDDVGEAEAIKRAMESSKKILVDVNQAVKHAEDAHKLQNIQRKLDKSTFDKDEFKNLDLTQHRLIHDGCLTMKKNPGIQLHGLLFENMIVLLTKQDDKYSLKYLNATRISEVNNKPLSPIMNIDSETLVRQEAADKNSFFLIKTKTSQMLELRAPSSSECKTWFKHISDAAEQYKPRSKNTPHESVDDPAIATLPHSNTKESVDITQEQPPPASATATMITTPLAPMMMLPSSNHYHPHPHHHHCIDLRNGREGTSFSEASVSVGGSFPSSVSVKNNRMGSIDLSSSVNRTMSTRSCGDNSNNYVNTCERAHQLALAAANGVTLRHTQSARQAAAATETGDDESSDISSGSKRDSTSIIYSNNSNNTRTLMQSSALVEPTAIQISISPAHTAEPVLTPAEKLRRLDVAIRDGLLEKQKIICDMFRLPIEHFNEIIDIASLPEAPKDSSDIALATYAQVQSLTEVVNEYMKVTPEQEISAVSMSVCDQCHEKQRKQQLHANGNIFRTPPTPSVHSAASNVSSAASPAAQRFRSPSPPPLPPPNKQQAQAQHKTTTPAKRQTHSLDEQIIHEDDDGYCEIDELRLPALPSMMSASVMSAMLSKPAATAPPPLPPPAGKFKSSPPPPPPPPPSAAVVEKVAATTGSALTTTEQLVQSNSPQLTKRQSTLSAESIPEESAEEVTKALGDNVPAAAINEEPSNEMADDDEMTAETGTEAASLEVASTEDAKKEKNNIENPLVEQEEKVLKVEPEDKKDDDGAIKLELKSLKPVEEHNNDEQRKELDVEAAVNTVTSAISSAENASEADGEVAEVSAYEPVEKDTENAKEAVVLVPAELQQQSSMATEVEQPLANREQIAINEASDTLATLKIMVDSMCQTTLTGSGTGGQTTASYCGPNRIMHATSLEPSVPCYALNSIVTALNTQISLLLPKINERDMERDRLRKENQHLRELLNAMHEHQRVQAKMETPKDITTSADANDEIDAPSSTCFTSNTNSKASSCNAAVKEVANTDNTEAADKG